MNAILRGIRVPEAQKSYDYVSWNTLIQVDADIASAAAYLGKFGERYVDDLADSYLAIGEKRYLAAIVAKIQRQAEEEVRPAEREKLRPERVDRTSNDNAASGVRLPPEYDAAKWDELANADPAVEAAIVSVGRFGSYYVADLAASYQAIDDKSYLERIVETIVAEAHVDLMQSTNARSQRFATAETTNNPQSDPTSGESAHVNHGQSSRPAGSSEQTDKASGFTATGRVARFRAGQGLAFAAMGILFFVFAVAAGLTLYEYSIFRAAHGDADRLEAYQHNCWICAFAGRARHEVEEAAARRAIAIAADRDNFESARGDIFKIKQYILACHVCRYIPAAQLELSELLRKQADISAEQARASELQKEQQSRTPPPQPYEPPHNVILRMTNSTEAEIAIQFFSRTRKGFKWSSSSANWTMNAGKTEDYNLACQTGEVICYGGYAQAQYWGVGLGDFVGHDCCISCDGALHSFELKSEKAYGLE